MPIFRVTVEYELYVESSDPFHAEAWVLQNQRDWSRDLEPEVSSTLHVGPSSFIPDEWLNDEPYNGDTGKTIAQILRLDAESKAEDERIAREKAEWDSHPKLLEV